MHLIRALRIDALDLCLSFSAVRLRILIAKQFEQLNSTNSTNSAFLPFKTSMVGFFRSNQVGLVVQIGVVK